MLLPPLVSGTLLRRYKRFLAEVELGGERVTAWCPNPGRMTSCAFPGERVWLSAARPGRKLRWTWELAEDPAGGMIMVHTGRANAVVAEAIQAGRLAPLAGYGRLQREVAVGASRLDLMLDDHPDDARRCFVEVKSVTMKVAPGLAAFPDAVTARGRKHLRELLALAEGGHRAVLLFAVSRDDCQAVCPADHVDPAYADTLRQVAAQGVELRAFGMDIDGRELRLAGELPVRL